MTARNTIGVVGKSGSNAVPVTTTTDTRFTLAALLRRASGMRARTGTVRGSTGGNLFVSGTAGWAYSVEPGAAVIAPDAASGAYIVTNDGTLSVATSVKPATGSRIDIIYIVQKDAWDRAAVTTAAEIGVAVGTSSVGTPVAPALPDGALELARNTMTSAATTTLSAGNSIVNTAPFTTMAGGIVGYRDATEEAADTGARAGDLSYRMDYGRAQLLHSTHRPLAFADEAVPRVNSAAERDAWVNVVYAGVGGATQGLRVWRADLGYEEQYYALYNAGTNANGAKAAGWYPAPGAEVYFNAKRLNINNMGLATTPAAFGGAGLFTAPKGNLPFSDAGTYYSNSNFVVYKNGSFVPLIEGRYEIFTSINWANIGTVVQTYIVKNQTIIDNHATNTLAGADFATNGSATHTIEVRADNVPLTNTDYVVVINKNTSATVNAAGYLPFEASARMEMRWVGVIHA